MTTEYPMRSAEMEPPRETAPVAPPRPPLDLVRVLSAVPRDFVSVLAQAEKKRA